MTSRAIIKTIAFFKIFSIIDFSKRQEYMNTKKKSSVPIILEEKTSFWVFFWPIIILFGVLFYVTKATNYNIFFILLAVSFSFVQPFLLFWRKRITITDRKIYVFQRGKKILSWHLIHDFSYINYEQSMLGKIFGYGTLIIINKNKEVYTYIALSNVFKVYETIIMCYEKAMVKRFPEYQPVYGKNLEKDESLDQLEE